MVRSLPLSLSFASFASFAVLAPALAGCANLCPEVRALNDDAGSRTLAVGDSIFAWSADRCQSVMDHAALSLDAPVLNRAVNGARVLDGSPDKPAIPEQYALAAKDGAWDVVIVNGGGNDLNGTCECGACADVLDALIAADATSGAMVELVEDIAATGARVVLVDYFVLHEDAWYGFDRCTDALAELDARYQLLASMHDAVTLVDLGDVVTPTEHPEAYAFDHVHPSDRGAALMGALVADAVPE